MGKLRFAALPRVSTESQEKQGESLRTQRTQLIEAVSALGGEISCWYGGQEHSTPGYERKLLEKLLEESSKGLFDAVIVADPSRWSRDNLKSKQGLGTLKDNHIRFFTGTTEYDLYDPTATLFLGMNAEIGEYFARNQAKKSLENRIHRAKRGVPSAGKLPFGRTFDRKTETWGIDLEKKQKIEWAAAEYIKGGKNIYDLAQLLGMNEQYLWSVLRFKCGDDWSITFNVSKLNIHEVVSIKIPRLLPEATIQAVLARMEGNKTFSHGKLKHEYLLKRMIFCDHCGTALTGESHPNRSFQVYRHQSSKTVKRACPFKNGWYVRKDQIEEAVLAQLYAMLGDVGAIERAMERAVPDLEKIEGLRSQKYEYEKKLQTLQKESDRVVNSISKGIITDEKARSKMDEITSQENLLKAEISKIESQTANIPTPKEIKQRAGMIRGTLKWINSGSGHFSKMTIENKRKLLEQVFGGKDASGKRLGVYITNEGGTARSYIIRGNFGGDIIGKLPMHEGEREDLVGKDSQVFDIIRESINTKSSCH